MSERRRHCAIAYVVAEVVRRARARDREAHEPLRGALAVRTRETRPYKFQLTPQEATVIRLRRAGLTQNDLADALGVGKSRAGKVLQEGGMTEAMAARVEAALRTLGVKGRIR